MRELSTLFLFFFLAGLEPFLETCIAEYRIEALGVGHLLNLASTSLAAEMDHHTPDFSLLVGRHGTSSQRAGLLHILLR